MSSRGSCAERAERTPEPRIRELAAGRESITPLEALDLPIPPEDRVWLVLREEFIPAPQLRELAYTFHERVLPIYEGVHPNDDRARCTLEILRRWLDARFPFTASEIAMAGASGSVRAISTAIMKWDAPSRCCQGPCYRCCHCGCLGGGLIDCAGNPGSAVSGPQ